MGYSLPGSSDHGIFQARVLEWVAISFFRGSSWPRDRTQVSCIAGRFFTTKSPGKPLLQRGKYKTIKIFCLPIPSLSLFSLVCYSLLLLYSDIWRRSWGHTGDRPRVKSGVVSKGKGLVWVPEVSEAGLVFWSQEQWGGLDTSGAGGSSSCLCPISYSGLG